jgi:hypothetical protein
VGFWVKEIIGFIKKGGMKWPFKSSPPTLPTFPMGPYRLDLEIGELTGLREFSTIEYRGVTRQFKGERIYHAPDVEYLGNHWKMMLNVVNGMVYKITTYIETKDKDLANSVAMNTFLYCKNQIGEPNKQRNEMFIWKTIDGNIALKTTQAPEGFGINLFLTSHAIHDFSRLW